MSGTLDSYIEAAQTIVISGHIRPDGDCIGSTLGCWHYIRDNYPEKKLWIFLESFLEAFDILPDAEVISHDYAGPAQPDLFISLDAASVDRLGQAAKYLSSAKDTLCIDHHVSNPGFARTNIIAPDASSACEVLYGLLAPECISRETAMCLYTGIIHDTGVFQYASTSPQTMNIAAQLMSFDIDHNRLIDETFNLKTYAQNRILGKCLDQARLYLDGQVIYCALTAEDLREYQVAPKHLDGIAAQMRLTRGVKAAVFLYPLSENEYKVSFRSSGVDVSSAAVKFGGGGHVRAAGCDINGTEPQIREMILEELSKILS